MFKRIAVTLLCVASLSGCAGFISSGTGTAPVGTESGARSLGQVFIDNSIERTAKINLYIVAHFIYSHGTKPDEARHCRIV